MRVNQGNETTPDYTILAPLEVTSLVTDAFSFPYDFAGLSQTYAYSHAEKDKL